MLDMDSKKDGTGVSTLRFKGQSNLFLKKNDITDCIVTFYNCERMNSALGNLPLTVYERKMAKQEPIVVPEIT